jgi:hypothetical protein
MSTADLRFSGEGGICSWRKSAFALSTASLIFSEYLWDLAGAPLPNAILGHPKPA